MATDRTDTTRTGTAGLDRNPDPITDAPGSHPTGVGIGGVSGGATGAAIGMIGGPIGAVIGAIAGTIVGGYVGKGVGEKVDPTEDFSEHNEYWRSAHKDRPYYKDEYKYEDDLAPAYRYGHTIGLHGDSDYDRPVGAASTTETTGASSGVGAAIADKSHAAGRAVGQAYESVKEKVTGAFTPDAKTGSASIDYDTHEADIRAGWDKVRGKSSLSYDQARDAIRDAYDRRLKLRQEKDVADKV